MTEQAEIDPKSLLDPMTRSILNHPNIYGGVAVLFWLISIGCLAALQFSPIRAWTVGACVSCLIAAMILGMMIVAVRRAKRLVAELSKMGNKSVASDCQDA